MRPHSKAVAALTLSSLTLASVAGPLSPPAGAVGPTMKTLNDVEPRTAINAANTPGDADSLFKITQPGSYYLTGNVQGVSGKMGIEVTAGNVTIDLNGFNMVGVAGSLTGVNAYQMSRIVVKNGTLSFWGSRGVVMGAGGSASDLAADHCGSTGIECTQDCTVFRCRAIANVTGIAVDRGCIVQECQANSNTTAGIASDDAAQISRCVSSENGGVGIAAGAGTTVADCTSCHNGDDGIQATDSCTITGNTCGDNGDDGIQVYTNCVVSRNHCTLNDPSGDGGGVYIHGTGNRVEDNLFYANHYGVSCSATDNFIAKNTCRASTGLNFSVTAGNELAPVITNPGSNGFATMTPWSNVAY